MHWPKSQTNTPPHLGKGVGEAAIHHPPRHWAAPYHNAIIAPGPWGRHSPTHRGRCLWQALLVSINVSSII